VKARGVPTCTLPKPRSKGCLEGGLEGGREGGKDVLVELGTGQEHEVRASGFAVLPVVPLFHVNARGGDNGKRKRGRNISRLCHMSRPSPLPPLLLPSLFPSLLPSHSPLTPCIDVKERYHRQNGVTGGQVERVRKGSSERVKDGGTVRIQDSFWVACS